MADVHRFQLENVGRMFRIMSGPGVPGGSSGRYQIRCSNVLDQNSVSYSASVDELRLLHRWITAELAYRAGAQWRQPHVR